MAAPKKAEKVETPEGYTPVVSPLGSETPEGYTLVVSPLGSETTVPDGILEVLIESGYTKK